jgi:hypothetical protein
MPKRTHRATASSLPVSLRARASPECGVTSVSSTTRPRLASSLPWASVWVGSFFAETFSPPDVSPSGLMWSFAPDASDASEASSSAVSSLARAASLASPPCSLPTSSRKALPTSLSSRVASRLLNASSVSCSLVARRRSPFLSVAWRGQYSEILGERTIPKTLSPTSAFARVELKNRVRPYRVLLLLLHCSHCSRCGPRSGSRLAGRCAPVCLPSPSTFDGSVFRASFG